VKGLLLDWYGSYREQKKQRLDLKFPKFNNPSNWHVVKHGVPQGLVLDPLLFSLYINDFPILINEITNAIMFADVTSMFVAANMKEELTEKFYFILIHVSK
jgi:hypothetical protein